MTKRRPGAKLGRPKELTRTLILAVAAKVRAGNYLTTAAACAGVHRSTLGRWLRDGELELEAGPLTLKAELVLAVQKAIAEAEAEQLGAIRRAARKGTWVAAAWMLERKDPKRWGRRDRPPGPNPDEEMLGTDAAARLADDLSAALESGDQAAMREALPRAMGLILNGAILKQLSALGPSTGAHALRALARTLEDIGGAKLIYPTINVTMGRPAQPALPDGAPPAEDGGG